MFQYFDITEVLPYQALFNFIIGERGVGKTYSTKKLLVRKFKQRGDKFIFVKRSEDEIKHTAPEFFNDVCDETTDIMFIGKHFYIGFPQDTREDEQGDRPVEKVEHTVKKTDEKITIKTSIQGRPGFSYRLFGTAVGLRTTSKLKGIPYDETYKWALFDEFIPLDGRWLHNEAELIFDIHETVFRLRNDCRWLFLANSNNRSYLPIFDQLGCEQVDNFEPGKITRMKANEVLVLYTNNIAYQRVKSKTKFGKLTEGTDWFKAMIKNVANSRDYDEWVGYGDGFAGPLFYLVSADRNYAFCNHGSGKKWLIYEVNKMPATKRKYAIDKSDITLPLWQPRSNILDCLAQRRLRFDKIQTAETFFNFFGTI